jgi:hypothetical protein
MVVLKPLGVFTYLSTSLFGQFVMVFALVSYTFEADNQGNYSYLVIVVTMCFTHCFE